MDFASALEQLEKTAAAAAQAPQDRRRPRDADDPHHQRNQRPRHHQQQPPPSSNSLDGLLQWGYRMAPYQAPPVPDGWSERPKHVALLALTIDELPYEHLWRAFATDESSSLHVSLLCHAKFPERVQSAWLQQRLLVRPPRPGRGHSYAAPEYHSRRPEWGSVQLTRAMVDLVVSALKIGSNEQEQDARFSSRRFWIGKDDESSPPADLPPVDKFLFISETCLPVCTLSEFEQALFPAMENAATVEAGDAKKGEREDAEPTTEEAAESKEQDGGDTKATAQSDSNDGDKGTVAESSENQEADSKTAAETKENGDEKPAAAASVAPSSETKSASVNWETSWVNARNRDCPGTPRNKYESDQFQLLDRRIPQCYRYKADQWMLLSRPHAQAVVHVDAHMSRRPRDQLWNLFSRINASDEMYFPTVLALLRILKDGDNETVQRRPVTYTDWSEGMRNPATYSRGVSDLRRIARLARAKGSLVARKFVVEQIIPGRETQRTGDISVDEWKAVLEELSTDSPGPEASANATK